MSGDFRVERDSMGEMRVPGDAYYGGRGKPGGGNRDAANPVRHTD
jgi:aspartate ammonia-lyase